MIKYLHSTWAYLVILIYVITLATYFWSLFKNKVFDFSKEFRLASFTLIVLSIQILLGLSTWFTSQYFEGIRNGQMGVYMKNAGDRLLVMEHPVMMLIAWLLTFYGFNRMRKAMSSKKKYMAVIITYGIAFLLVLGRIPWHNWLK